MTRLTIELEDSQKQQIKILAALQNLSIKDFILTRALGNDSSNNLTDKAIKSLNSTLLEEEKGELKSYRDIKDLFSNF